VRSTVPAALHTVQPACTAFFTDPCPLQPCTTVRYSWPASGGARTPLATQNGIVASSSLKLVDSSAQAKAVSPKPPRLPETPMPELVRKEGKEKETLSPFSKVLIEAKVQQNLARASQTNWTSLVLPMPMSKPIPEEVMAEVTTLSTPKKTNPPKTSISRQMSHQD